MLEAEIEIIPGLPQVGIGGKDSTLRRALYGNSVIFRAGLPVAISVRSYSRREFCKSASEISPSLGNGTG